MAVGLLAFPAAAQTLFHRAENGVQVALIKVVRAADHTEIHLQTPTAIKGVCWSATGDNSPYLLADGKRYRYLKGNNVTDCPAGHDYAGQGSHDLAI